MLNEADILDALRVCYDPELKINVVDLGCVSNVSIETDAEAPGVDRRLCVTVGLLHREQDADAMLVAIVTNRLLGLRDISRANVQIVSHPAWDASRMTPAGRREWSKRQGLIQLG